MTRALGFVALITAAGLGLAGCGGGSPSAASPPASGSSPAPAVSATTPLVSAPDAAAATGCARSEPPRHYVIDRKHSGTLTAHNYSQSADVQAALQYDQLRSGSRAVYLHRSGGAIDRVASCVVMQFATPHLANRFFLSYQDTRDHAPSIVRKLSGVGAVSGVTGMTAYFEKDQSFRGYHIASTNVVELAGQAGATLFIASVAAASPSVDLARTLLESMVTS
jgi:hypothetical protein